MAHELRTPLAAIGGYAELLEHGMHGPVTDGQTDALRRIKRNQQLMVQLIATIMDFAEVSTGSASIASQPVPLGPVIDEVKASLRSQLEDRDLIVVWPSVDGEGVVGDPRRVAQALRLLIEDAVHVAPAGSTVQLEIDRDAATTAIRVASDGPPIAPEDAPAAFRPFDRNGRAARGGQDLALPLASLVARAMSGSVSLGNDSPDGGPATVGGRRLELRLPRAD